MQRLIKRKRLKKIKITNYNLNQTEAEVNLKLSYLLILTKFITELSFNLNKENNKNTE